MQSITLLRPWERAFREDKQQPILGEAGKPKPHPRGKQPQWAKGSTASITNSRKRIFFLKARLRYRGWWRSPGEEEPLSWGIDRDWVKTTSPFWLFGVRKRALVFPHYPSFMTETYSSCPLQVCNTHLPHAGVWCRTRRWLPTKAKPAGHHTSCLCTAVLRVLFIATAPAPSDPGGRTSGAGGLREYRSCFAAAQTCCTTSSADRLQLCQAAEIHPLPAGQCCRKSSLGFGRVGGEGRELRMLWIVLCCWPQTLTQQRLSGSHSLPGLAPSWESAALGGEL